MLLIDIINPELARLALVSKNRIREHHFQNQNLSENLLLEIKKFCRKQKIKLSDLTKIEVQADPGHFSKTRTVVATANALAFGLKLSQDLRF